MTEFAPPVSGTSYGSDFWNLDDANKNLYKGVYANGESNGVGKCTFRDPWSVIEGSEKGEWGVYSLNEEGRAAFAELLSEYGVLAEKPTEEQVQAGIEQARAKIQAGEAESYLRGLDFMSERMFKNLQSGSKSACIRFSRDKELYVDSRLISGAAMMESWAGRDKSRTKVYGNSSGKHVDGPSIGAIEDYAGRDTQLPSLENHALNIILTNQGVMLRVGDDTHRTAAAKLRGVNH